MQDGPWLPLPGFVAEAWEELRFILEKSNKSHNSGLLASPGALPGCTHCNALFFGQLFA
jgi:hypothetical protein